MSLESALDTRTKVTFLEVKPYSFVTNTLGLIDKIFDDPESNSIKNIATKLLASSIGANSFSKEITIGAEAFDNSNACTNRLLREVEFGVTDNVGWSLLRNLLLKSGKPQDILLSLNKLGVIDKNTDQWELLRLIEKHNSKQKN